MMVLSRHGSQGEISEILPHAISYMCDRLISVQMLDDSAEVTV